MGRDADEMRNWMGNVKMRTCRRGISHRMPLQGQIRPVWEGGSTRAGGVPGGLGGGAAQVGTSSAGGSLG
jgi:hypothetical protein